MDVDAIQAAMQSYIARHNVSLNQMPRIQSQLLELGALVLAAEHYRIVGYTVTTENLVNDRFRLKRNSVGKPWNFSWFRIRKDADEFDIHANLTVLGAYGLDEGRYVVDVGVCHSGILPIGSAERKSWISVENAALITFIEAKRLVVYPMLLAQFIGIVHELQPKFLAGSAPEKFQHNQHFPPTLVTTGHIAAVCRGIRAGFLSRGFNIAVLPNLDLALAQMRTQTLTNSPLLKSDI